MSFVTVTFNTPGGIAPLTARQDDIEATVTRYLKRVTGADHAQYDPTSRVGVAFLGSRRVATFRTTPLGGTS